VQHASCDQTQTAGFAGIAESGTAIGTQHAGQITQMLDDLTAMISGRMTHGSD
jgi:hypothetical protein